MTNKDLYIKHLEKTKKSNSKPDKYGYLVFEYPYAKIKNKDYFVEKTNIGDYIQSIAARQFLPSFDEAIDRDLLAHYDREPVNAILNSWYFIQNGNKTFSDKINPLLIAIHINNTEKTDEKTIEYFKKHEPIGCRDFHTMEFLNSKGVEAYFSGCLTTTLDINYAVEEKERTDEILFVDFEFNTNLNLFYKKSIFYDKTDKLMRKVLKQTEVNNVVRITHEYDLDKSQEEYFETADKLLKRYARAKLVVTSRIHAALPCIAMNTPVILVVKQFDEKRFKGLADFLNIVGYDINKKPITKIARDKNNNIINPANHIEYAQRLKEICTEFCKTK